MSLKDRIHTKSKALVLRERITLPQAGEEIIVRGLMSGELLRVRDAKDDGRRGAVLIALGTEDPATNRPVWNANDVKDLEAVGELHIEDMNILADTISRLSGTDKVTEAEVLGNLDRTLSSSTSSASDSASPPQSSVSE